MRLVPYFFLILFAFAACNTNKSDKEAKNTSDTVTEESKDEVLWEDPPMLLGTFDIPALQEVPYKEWYTPIYEETILDEDRVEYLGSLLKEVEIKAYVGTWCSDTQIELPNLIKTLDRVNFDFHKLSLIGVDEDYQAPDKSNLAWDIVNVPTFILLKDQKEIGRFVEFPDESLLEDLIQILEDNK